MITRETTAAPFWAMSKEDVLKTLETADSGLASAEALSRFKIFGHNALARSRHLTRTRIFFSQFGNPLIILLLIASGITIILGSEKDAIFIGVAAILNVILGFYQENKAEKALARLKHFIEDRVRVFRDGHEMELEAESLVPGDIVHLTQGGRVPADCRVIYGNDFYVDESILTGESLPVEKVAAPVKKEAVIGDRRSCVFKGTLVAQGFGNAVVFGTGQTTELGKIAALIAAGETSEATPLRRAISRFSLRISFFLIAFTVLLFSLGIARGTPIFEMFLTSVAVIVSAVPEGLPIAITVILAIGVERLSRERGVVRRLLAAETLGDTSVILTDKTGTLTEAKIELTKIITRNSEAESELLRFAVMNTDAVIENPTDDFRAWRIVGRPLEQSLISGAAAEGILLPAIKKNFELLDYLPFSSEKKFSASIIVRAGQRYLNVLGAPDIILDFVNLSDTEREAMKAEINEMAGRGERVLGVAVKELGAREGAFLRKKEFFSDLRFLGTLSFRDPVRSGIKEAVSEIQAAGVKTIIVTGDHRGTAESVAREIGFKLHPRGTLNGADLTTMSDLELKSRLSELQIVSRVSPEGKVRIAKAFRTAGEVVAMTGDGVNDAASLKEADIGVAMGSGTDIAKDVADLVLLDDNFETIVSAIREGRRIAENIRKVIVYLLANVFNELFLIGGALFLGIATPINALQILWVNLVTDSFPAVSMAFENHVDYLRRRPGYFKRGLLDKRMRFIIFGVGALTSLILIALYSGLLKSGADPDVVRTFIFAAFGTNTLFVIFSLKSLTKGIFSYNPFSNFKMVGAVAFGFALMIAAIYLPSLQRLLDTTALPPIWVFGVVAYGLLNVVCIEGVKSWFRRRQFFSAV